MKICEICGIEFEKHASYANHVRWKHRDNSMFSETMKNVVTNLWKNKVGEKIEIEVECEKCKSIFKVKKREKVDKHKRFCSPRCANSRNHSSETKNKISSTLSTSIKKKWENGDYDNSNHKKFSSRAEREILSYLKEKYVDDEWTSGGCIKIDDELISRDVYSNKLKICVEYDGVWHFKDIHGQLEVKQKKDRLLNEWCEKNEWRIIRISESYWHENKKNFHLIEDALNLSDSIFLGKEYDAHLNN